MASFAASAWARARAISLKTLRSFVMSSITDTMPFERSLASTAVRDPDLHMLVDYDELRGMGTHFSELLSPFLRTVLQAGLMRPR